MNPETALQDRIVDLESRLAFQEHTLQTLSDIIARQQREIDALHQRLRHAEEQVRNMAPPSPQQGDDEPPPPHY